MFISCEESQIIRNVNFLYYNKRRFCFNAMQYHFCLVTKRTIRFRIELELNWFAFQQNSLKTEVSVISLGTPLVKGSILAI